MIHRGLYGLDRLALDILTFDSAADFVDYIDDDCLPDTLILSNINDPRLFLNAIELKSKYSLSENDDSFRDPNTMDDDNGIMKSKLCTAG